MAATRLLMALCVPAQLLAQGVGTVRGTVRATDGVPLALARISVVGSKKLTLTTPEGTFEITRVVPGVCVLQVRLLGYMSVLLPVEVQAGETAQVTVALAAAAVPLEAILVKADPAPYLPAMQGFEERRAHAQGHFFNRAEIARMQPRVFTDVLRRVPGVLIQPAPGAFGPNDMVRMARTTGVAGGRPCPVLFYINGTPFPVTGDISINQYVVPEDVIAVEVYNGTSQIPPQFQANLLNARCGVVVIWTRVGNEDDRPPEPFEDDSAAKN